MLRYEPIAIKENIMKLKKFFNNYFKKHNTSNFIATFGNLVDMPKREDFSDELSNLKIDELKAFFRDILSKSKTLTSTSIHDEHLQQELDMNLDLLMNISFDKEIEPLNDEEKRIRSLIIYSKLKLYLNRIIELENEIKYRIIALKELEKESFGFSIKSIFNRKSLVKEEINNLLGILCVLKNQRYAIFSKVNACSTEFKTINNSNEEIELSGSKYLTSRLKRLEGYADIILTQEQINDVNSFDEPINQTAALERYFEIYSYTHSNDVDQLRDDLFYYTRNFRTMVKYEMPKSFDINSLKSIEAKLRVLDEFGKNIVSTEDIFNLYKLIFNYKTVDIYQSMETSLFLGIESDERDFTEYSVYAQIVMQMIEEIRNDKDHLLTYQFDTKHKDFWNTFNAILNPGADTVYDGVYDANAILTNNLSLAFLLATYSFGLKSFFKKVMIKTPEYMQNIRNDDNIPIEKHYELKLTDKISLESFVTVFDIIDNLYYLDRYTLDYFLNNDFRLIADIYKMIHPSVLGRTPELTEAKHIIPEGIITMIKRSKNQNMYSKSDLVFDGLVNPGQSKEIYLPSSLKETNTTVFEGKFFKSIIFNNGIEKFYIDQKNEPIKANKVIIPSTMALEKYNSSLYTGNTENSLFGFDLNFLKEVHFTFIGDSKILNDKSLLREFFNKIIWVKDYGFKTLLCQIEKIYFWEEGIYNGRSVYFTNENINDIIRKIARDNHRLYEKVLDHVYERKQFTDLLVNRIIRIIHKSTGVTLCEKKKGNQKRVLKK